MIFRARERGREREIERERLKEKREVKKRNNLLVYGRCSNQLSHLARAGIYISKETP